MDTGAIFGFTNTLLDVLFREKPSHIGVAFDLDEPTFRHQQFAQYKAHRDAQPESITTAIPYIKKIVSGFGIPILEVPGYEADDVIGTLAKQAEKNDFQVFMMTSDKDYAQLVSKNIFLYKPSYMGNEIEIYDVEKVLKRFDIESVSQVADFLGLQGDSSDNIPGIPGVGEKTAIKLLKEYKTIENLIDHADKIPGKLGENIRTHKEKALLSKQLATIITDVPIVFDEKKLLYTGPVKDILQPIFEELEFKTINKRLFGEEKNTKNQSNTAYEVSLFEADIQKQFEKDPEELQKESFLTINDVEHFYHIIKTPEKCKELVKFLLLQQEFCFDTETTSTNALEAKLVGLSFAYVPQEAYYIPLSDDNVESFLEILKPVFEKEHILKIAHNLKYDLLVLSNYGIEIKGHIYDTMLAHYVLDSEGKHSMDAISQKYLGYKPIEIESLIGKKGKSQGSMADVELIDIAEYAAEDADITLQLKRKISKAISKVSEAKYKIKSLNFILSDIELPLVKVLADMEKVGIKIDVDSLQESSDILQKEINILEKEIYELAKENFNISSSQQLGKILFDKLKLSENPKKTKTGQYATGEEVLQSLSDHKIVSLILEYRELQKLKNTYTDALPSMISKKDFRVHTTYNQAVASTGRLSSNNPNLQNIPIRTEKGKEIRKAFVPKDKNHLFLSADYSQIELRIMAAFSKDKTMIESFQNDRDIHASTASKIFKVDIEKVDKDMRRKAKTANFGIIYGISAFGLSQRLNIPRKEAAAIIESYFNEFPSVKKYMEEVIKFAREQGFVETLFGRRRYLKDINSRNMNQRSFAERNAINSPIQGTAADIIKLAMIKIYDFLKSENLKTKMILQVHDELLFEVPLEEKEYVAPRIVELMEGVAPSLGVPLKVEYGFGSNWLEAH